MYRELFASVILAFSVNADPIPALRATKAVWTQEAVLVFAAREPNYTSRPARTELFVLDPTTQEPERASLTFGIATRHTGPISWGMRGSHFYCLSVSEEQHITSPVAGCSSHQLSDRVAWWRPTLKGQRSDHDALSRMMTSDAVYGRTLTPLFGLFEELERNRGHRRYAEWEYWFDLVYTDSNHVSVMAVYDGTLTWWTFNKPEEEDWVERGEFPSEISSAFRIIRAGENLYLIDALGRVFSSPDRGHEQIGSITGWREINEGERLILLEEQRAGKILVVKVVAGVPIVLPFVGDAEAALDFLTEIDAASLRDALVRMAQILDEEEGAGKE